MPEGERKPKTIGLRIQDLAGLVVGYSLAALLVRSFRAEFNPLEPGKAGAVGVSFLWLGLAMSGPVVLLLDSRRRGPPPTPPSTHPPSRYSGMELAWIGVGGYFIALTLFVVPARNREAPWTLIMFAQAIGSAILIFWMSIDPKRRETAKGEPTRWTTRVARLLIVTWPFAWIAMILVFR